MLIGSRLKDARVREGWSQLQLAEACGWKKSGGSRIFNYEQGRDPSVEDCQTIADVLGVSPCWLAFGAVVEFDDALDTIAPRNQKVIKKLLNMAIAGTVPQASMHAIDSVLAITSPHERVQRFREDGFNSYVVTTVSKEDADQLLNLQASQRLDLPRGFKLKLQSSNRVLLFVPSKSSIDIGEIEDALSSAGVIVMGVEEQ